MRRFGYLPGEVCVCLGDLGSDSSSKSSNETTNNQIGQQGAPNSEMVAISGSSNVTVTSASPEIVKRGLELAENVANYSQANVTYALGALRDYQERSLASVDRAVESAQTVALTATPTSPGMLAEISQNQFKQILLALGGGVLLLFLFKRK